MPTRIALLTVLTLIAFAMNSILCRLALANSSIDAASFTLIRLTSGAITLAVLSPITKKRNAWNHGSWVSGALLFAYAAAFSYSYLKLSAGTGGLILFGSVQFTMIGIGIFKGERPGLLEWLGLAIALGGLVILMAPGLHAPAPVGAALMVAAGCAWGLYSLRGRGAKEPVLATSDNFLKSVPFAIITAAIAYGQTHATGYGVTLAIVSGAITSGIGYVLWYSVLPHLTATRAAISQLAVPALVAIMGVVALSEQVSPRFLIASALMLGGVAMAVLRKRQQ